MTIKTPTMTAASAAIFAAMSTAAFAGQIPGDFAAIDTNADGQVTYQEYAKSAKGMTQTAAAQQFIKISNGNPFFTEGDLMTAVALQGQAGWGQNQTIQPFTTSQPNTTVLNSSTQADIPRWSDGTPVDLDAPSVTVNTAPNAGNYVSETSGAYSAPKAMEAGTHETTTHNGSVMKDVTTATETKVWSETGESGAAGAVIASEAQTDVTINPSTGATGDVNVETETKTVTDTLEKEAVDMMKEKSSNLVDDAMSPTPEPKPEQ